MAVPWCHWT